MLLVSGYRNNDLIDLAVPETRFMLDIGSGGSALVLRRDAGRNEVLASAFRGDGSLSGAVRRARPGRQGLAAGEPGTWTRAHFVVPDEEAFKGSWAKSTMPNFYAVIREAVRRSGLPADGIDYLAILHFKRSAHDAVLAELGLQPEQSTYLDDYGHLGQNDQVLSLELGLRDGKVKDGSRIVFVGAGLGFVWASTVIRWGPHTD